MGLHLAPGVKFSRELIFSTAIEKIVQVAQNDYTEPIMCHISMIDQLFGNEPSCQSIMYVGPVHCFCQRLLPQKQKGSTEQMELIEQLNQNEQIELIGPIDQKLKSSVEFDRICLCVGIYIVLFFRS